MKYLLDTNTCISLLKNVNGIRAKIIAVGMDECCVSEITIAELYYGAAKSGRTQHYDDVRFIQDHFEILPIQPALDLFGRNKYALEAKGMRIDDFDLLIASTAIFNNLTVVTHNTKHFNRIQNLQVEDWE